MSRLLSAFGLEKRSTSVTYGSFEAMLADLGGGTRSSSGVAVTREKAMSVSAWWRGIDIRSGALARIGPPQVKRRVGKAYEVDTSHPAHLALSQFADQGITPFDFYRTCGVHRLNAGSAYALVDRVSGVARRLILLDPDRMQPFRENGQDGYLYTFEDVRQTPRKIPASDVWHFRGMSWHARAGWKNWLVARDTLGAAMAMRDHGSAVFKNGAAPGLVVEFPEAISVEDRPRVEADWRRSVGGVDNHFKLLLMDAGKKLVSAPQIMSAEAAQLVESRVMEIREIANFLGVPSHYLGDPNGRAYNSQEQDEQGFLNHTIEPDLVSCEQEASRVLLTEEERTSGSVVIEFDRDRLITADAKSRSETDKAALAGVPWKTLDEVRQEHGYGPLPEGRGAALIIPINLQQAAKPGSEADPATKTPPADPEADALAAKGKQAIEAVSNFVVETRRRMLRRLTSAARAAGKHPAKFGDWLDGFAAEHAGVVRDALAPADGVLDTKALAAALFAEVRGVCDAAYSTAKPAAFAEALDAALARLEA